LFRSYFIQKADPVQQELKTLLFAWTYEGEIYVQYCQSKSNLKI